MGNINSGARGKNHPDWSGGLSYLSNADEALNASEEDQQAMLEWLSRNSEVCPVNGCWLWTKFLDKDGYGRANLKNCATGAHKLSFILHYKHRVGTMYVLHTCDVRSCSIRCTCF